jgi:hypothetical protein
MTSVTPTLHGADGKCMRIGINAAPVQGIVSKAICIAASQLEESTAAAANAASIAGKFQRALINVSSQRYAKITIANL